MKSEIFAKILTTVANVTELSKDQILSKTKTDDLVAARSLFVHYCAAYGISSISITSFMGRSRSRSVSRYLSSYNSFHKSSYMFRQMDGRIGAALSAQLSH